MALSVKFQHVVFPRQGHLPRAVDLSTPTEPSVSAPEADLDLSVEHASFFRWLFLQAGLEARLYRGETLERRLPACLRSLRVATPAQARRLLEQKPELVQTAVSSMLVGVTAFFRNPPVFDFLRREVLPGLRGIRNGIYAWSAGCSDGAELYSIAILLSELNLLSGSYLLGSDCRPDAIQRAKEGCFDSLALKNIDPLLLDRYFLPGGGRRQVCSSLRRSARFKTADILKTREPGVWDLIFFRNTAMYFRPEAASLLWENFETSLRPGGVLVLGKAERPAGRKSLVPLAPCIYRRNHR